MLASAQLMPIAYHADSSVWYRAIRHLSNPVWLDSGRPQSHYGRYDILAAAPAKLIITRGEKTHIYGRGELESETTDNPFDVLQALLPTGFAPLPGIPFCGGAIGFLGYDLGRRLETLPNLAVQDIDLPEMRIGIYHWALVQDHEQKQAWLVHLPDACDMEEIIEITGFHNLKQNIKFETKPFKINKFKSNLNAIKYANSVRAIQTYILAGDCYQVNYAQQFSSQYSGDSLQAYLALRAALPSPFSAFMEFDHQAVLSLSPERFIRVSDSVAETQPIKGTIARGADTESDNRNAEQLQASVKDRAENLMIVDLLRNDLSKNCADVKVPSLFKLQSFANVHHLVSTVCARLKPDVHPLQILRDCFPGGSITGAPKIRAMEIIEELEPTRRSLYCGSLGYISADGNMDTNIAIRTLICDGDNIHCWGGGGIVADSEVEKEYQESITKVKVLMDTLEEQFSSSDG
jgi:para-aminobenzoate synthetase component 1